MIPPNIDLDRLHNATELLVKTPQRRGRKEGKTVAYLMMLKGEVELGGRDNTYLYLGESAYFAARVAKSFAKLIQQEYPDLLVVHTRPEKVIVNGTQQFLFLSAPYAIDNPHCVRGFTLDRAFIDLCDESFTSLDHDGKLSAFFEEMIMRLYQRHGDVI